MLEDIFVLFPFSYTELVSSGRLQLHIITLFMKGVFRIDSRIQLPKWFACSVRNISNSHNTGNFMPYSSRILCGFFNVPHWTYKQGRDMWDGAYGF